MRIVAGAAAGYASAGYVTIIDGIVLPRFFFEPLADPLVVERLWHDFADLGPLSAHAVDVDAEDPRAAADLLDARIRDGTLWA